jgi:hypothetical protein
VGFSTAEISAVRALPVVLAVGPDGSWQTDPGFAEVVFDSTAAGKHHQVYVDGLPAGATLSTEDRSVIVPVAEHAASAIEVIAVDADNRLTDYSASLSGYDDGHGSRVALTWSGGRYLDDNLDHFDVYGGPTGQVDADHPLNAEPIPATIGGENLGGFGRGGFGRGGWGRSAMQFTFATGKYFPGDYEFTVTAVDDAGNAAGGPQATVEVDLANLVRPPDDLHVAQYDEQGQTVTLEWTASADLA